jgi:hypothetical protein
LHRHATEGSARLMTLRDLITESYIIRARCFTWFRHEELH